MRYENYKTMVKWEIFSSSSFFILLKSKILIYMLSFNEILKSGFAQASSFEINCLKKKFMKNLLSNALCQQA